MSQFKLSNEIAVFIGKVWLNGAPETDLPKSISLTEDFVMKSGERTNAKGKPMTNKYDIPNTALKITANFGLNDSLKSSEYDTNSSLLIPKNSHIFFTPTSQANKDKGATHNFDAQAALPETVALALIANQAARAKTYKETQTA